MELTTRAVFCLIEYVLTESIELIDRIHLISSAGTCKCCLTKDDVSPCEGEMKVREPRLPSWHLQISALSYLDIWHSQLWQLRHRAWNIILFTGSSRSLITLHWEKSFKSWTLSLPRGSCSPCLKLSKLAYSVDKGTLQETGDMSWGMRNLGTIIHLTMTLRTILFLVAFRQRVSTIKVNLVMIRGGTCWGEW